MIGFFRKNKQPVFMIGATLVVLLISACGIKPGELSPPGGDNGSEFPGTYPQD
jgi:hypothetical protein